jgi:hypothetical protein
MFVDAPALALMLWAATAARSPLLLVAGSHSAAAQGAPSDPGAPSEIEEALTEYACRQGRPPIRPYTEGWDECLSVRLQTLRTTFGINLKRLTEAERRTVDSVCYKIRADRDTYLQCLTDQLTALGARRSRGKGTPAPEPAPVAAATPLPDSASASASAASTPSKSTVQTRAPSGRTWIWIVGGLATAAAAGGIPLFMRTRRTPRTCQVCGSPGPGSGLCQKCRREAADAVRKAAQAREEQRRAEELDRVHGAREGAEPRLDEPAAAGAALEQLERQQQRVEAVRDDLMPPAEDESPSAILGVRIDASQDEILAAYSAAKAKYDLSLVDGLGDEIRAHFTAKGEAVERAYQILSK